MPVFTTKSLQGGFELFEYLFWYSLWDLSLNKSFWGTSIEINPFFVLYKYKECCNMVQKFFQLEHRPPYLCNISTFNIFINMYITYPCARKLQFCCKKFSAPRKLVYGTSFFYVSLTPSPHLFIKKINVEKKLMTSHNSKLIFFTIFLLMHV